MCQMRLEYVSHDVSVYVYDALCGLKYDYML